MYSLCFFFCEELADYRGADVVSFEGKNKNMQSTEELANACLEDRLTTFFREEHAESMDEQKMRAKALATTRELKANRYFALAFDNALYKGLHINIVDFIPARFPGPLTDGQTRHRILLPETRRVATTSDFRAVIKDDSTGASWVEVPRVMIDGQLQRRTLHKALDQGPIGRYHALWLDTHVKVRGTTTWDVFHSIHNALKDGLAEAGAYIYVTEHISVANMTTGPYHGHAFFNILHGASTRYFQTRTYECKIFRFLYEDSGVCAT